MYRIKKRCDKLNKIYYRHRDTEIWRVTVLNDIFFIISVSLQLFFQAGLSVYIVLCVVSGLYLSIIGMLQ